LANLTKQYGEVSAVAGIDLEVRQGEFFTMLGPSGSGKTTTLRMIAGFEDPTSGSIELAGADVRGIPPYDRAVNTVFQDYALFPHMTVGENVAYGLKVAKVSKAERAKRGEEALEMVRLPGYGDRKPGELSGGQRQRVALARAIVNRPKVLLLDEPLGALDLKLRKALQVELKRIQQEVGITFVYVTHDQEEALTMSDRIAVMNRGRVEQLGSPEELYDRPTTRFVADFIGTTNLLHGIVESVEDSFALVRLDSGERCRIGRQGRASGQEVDISVRPEAIAIHADHGSDGANRFLSATIQQSAYLGSAVQYIVRTTGGVALTVLTAKNAERLTAEQAVVLDWPPDEALVLGVRPVELEETG
jgi:spermidine/putrescine ABC transporter ATP-binding subunit